MPAPRAPPLPEGPPVPEGDARWALVARERPRLDRTDPLVVQVVEQADAVYQDC